MDVGERYDGAAGGGDSEKCADGRDKCCYDSKDTYDALPEGTTGICPPERFCCNLKEGQECPLVDFGVRGEVLVDIEPYIHRRR